MSSPISGFTAIPNPQMLAFMPIQSYLMMYFAGSGWQYGKRKISAMSNQEFNNLTPEVLLKQHSDELKAILPTLDKTLNDVTPLIATLIEQYGDFVREAIKALPDAIGNIFQQSGQVGDATIQNVRLSQGSQQFQRDRELYAGGSPSQFQLDQERQTKRVQAEADRLRMQEIFDAKQRIKKSEINRIVSGTQTPQVKRGVIGLKAAGQSQILERTKLIKEMARHQINSKTYTGKGQGRSGQNWRLQEARNFKLKQQKLVNLLARYRF